MPKVAGDMAGAQAQLLSAAQLSLWARTRGLRATDVETALWRDRTIVKTWCMRGSLHLIPSADFAAFVRGCARREARSAGWLAPGGFPIDLVNRAVESVRDVLDEPLTRSELAERVGDSLRLKMTQKAGRGWGGPSDTQGLVLGGRVLSVHGLVFLACMRGLACFGPMQGRDATFVRPDRWLPNWHDRSQEDAEAELLRTYLRAHGPANVTDYAMWTYMSASDSRAIWGRLEGELVTVSLTHREASILDADRARLVHAELGRPCVRLLPSFDSLLLGVKDKSHLVDAAHYKRVFRPQGWISPVVLVNGHAEGIWSHEITDGSLSVRIQPFRPLPREVRDLVRQEADDLGRYFGVETVRLVKGPVGARTGRGTSSDGHPKRAGQR